MPEVTRIVPIGQRAIKKIRVAAYCRVSTNSADQLNSYATQIRVYTTMIQRKPEWELVEVFADEGISGTAADKREEFMRMIGMCELKKIDLVITKSVSRFARNVKEALEYVRKLKLLGVGVQFEKEGINTMSLGDEMLLNTFAAIAQEESVAISQRLRWSNRTRMSNGTYISSNAPYGYRLVDGKLIICEDEAKTVQWIFQNYANGKSVSEIAKELETKGIQTKHGGYKWKYDVVSYILSNERYVGDVLLQKYFNYPTVPFQKTKNRGEEDQYYINQAHPAIVNRQLFDTVQKLLKERRSKYSHAIQQNIYPLTSRIQCLKCGSFYRRRIVNGCISWGCSKHIADRTQCDSQYYQEERIYDAYVGLVNKLRFSDEDMLTESIRLLDLAIAMKKRKNIQAQEASETLAELNTKLLMLEELRRKGYLAPEIYEGQAKTIRNQIHEIKQQKVEASKSKLEEVQAEIGELRKKLNQYEDPIERFDENLFKETVKSVTIDKNRRITFTLLGDLTFTETL